MKRSRDSQRARLYRAERCLPDHDRNVFGSIEATRDWLYNEVMTKIWFRHRWQLLGGVGVRVGRSYGTSYGRRGYVTFGRNGRNPATVLHELAHQILDRDTPNGHTYAAHGPEFAAVFLFLIGQVLGSDIAQKLRLAFAEQGVKYRSAVKVVPQPRYQVATKTDRTRQQAAKPVSPSSRLAAADVIRRLVKAGEFGKVGTKTRTHALAVARTLAK